MVDVDDLKRRRRFSNVWFDRDTKPVWDQHFIPYAASLARPIRYLEIGVCEGASMLYAIETIKAGQVVGIDPWQPPRDLQRLRDAFAVYRTNFFHNLEPYLGANVRHHERSSFDMIRDGSFAALGKFDVAYIDGDHRAAEALVDCIAGFWSLDIGGLMIIDDIHRRWHLGRPWVREAMRAFLDAFETRYTVAWRSDQQIAVRRTR